MATLLLPIARQQALVYSAFLVLYEFLTYIANDMIMPGMLNVVDSFHGREAAIALSLTAYVFGGASLQLILGPLSDRYGRRPVMIFGALFFVVCTSLIACSGSMEQFLWARFFQGMGLCFISVVGYATLQDLFAEMDAIRLMAIMANVAILAPLLGPLLGAVLIYYINWRMIFVIIGVPALFALWGLWRYMPESVGQLRCDGSRIQRVSLAPRVILRNYKQLLSNRSFILGSFALGVIYLPCMAWIGLSPIMLVKVAGLSVKQYGLWQLPVFGAYIVGNLLLHHLTHDHSVKRLIAIGSTIAGVSLVVTYLLPHVINDSFVWLMPGLMMYFLGVGMIGGPLTRFILFATEVSKGTASALMSMLAMSIQATGIEIANIVYSRHDNRRFADYCAGVFVVYAVILLGSAFKNTKKSENIA